ncbi:helix-turn-helix domain-containing protein [Arthrobacter sp. N1]|uniref:helix-turn-helix domain-containing protein n=1 Tax=Arthrobacter sp. N1 TaxID=619291 RepID=UPI003BAEBB4F
MTESPELDTTELPASSKPLRFLTLRQVADELNTGEPVIRGLIRSGELPAIQVGGRGQWRIERVKLEEFIAAAYARAAADIKRGDGPKNDKPAAGDDPDSNS